MLLITTIEIDEISTEVWIDFSNVFGDIEINKITNAETGDAIDVELTNDVYRELYEYAADYAADQRGEQFAKFNPNSFENEHVYDIFEIAQIVKQ